MDNQIIAVYCPYDDMLKVLKHKVDYHFDDYMCDNAGITVLPMLKRNSKRLLPSWVCFLQHHYRKMVETAGSLITQRFPKIIHAVTAAVFELTVVLFVLVFSIYRLQVAT